MTIEGLEPTGILAADQAKLLAAVKQKFEEREKAASRGEQWRSWSYADQQNFVEPFLAIGAQEGNLSAGERDKYLAKVFPNTKWGIIANFRALTGWLGVQPRDFFVDRSAEASKLIGRAIEVVDEPCLKLRAPGAMLFPLVKNGAS
jgi:hypothetical protein